ncbi:MAG: bifunctional phosphoribosylaminoimidazolecarboxamide formyltransferase/IMP cyclohydrolase [Deltaproteobacteria bacterium]|nr:bifunctional phosphoribosylaminoimidazolecarboxamide formyltransferase/IMP cyclohydrolase [Deltaproteobacteria bacterium]
MPSIERALLSVADKTGIVEFGASLHARGVTILSTGGTAAALRSAGVPITEVAEYTGAPEMLEGRVKTLHPKIHAGLLAVRSRPDHVATLRSAGIAPIDLVAVNLYPFAATIVRPDVTLVEAIEQIDIGGPALLRSAAKNYAHVVALSDPVDYRLIVEELAAHGAVTATTSLGMARKAFAHTAWYDGTIARYLAGQEDGAQAFPDRWFLACEKVRDLRYGENPHQGAAWYRMAGASSLIGDPLQGKALSYTNLLDADAAIGCVREFAEPAVCIVKHANPCGVGIGATLAEAFERAQAADPVSSYGGIVACNRPVDRTVASAIVEGFFEVVLASVFDAESRAVLAARKGLRVLVCDLSAPHMVRVRSACGGLLVQEPDALAEEPATWRVVTTRRPGTAEQEAMRLAWRVAKHAHSNAIVLASAERTLGIGAGQTARVDGARIAAMKMTARPVPAGDVIAAASDAFFPFRDGIDELARAGVTAVVQPGGSIRDAEVIAAADAHGIAMCLTGARHFRH